MANYDYVCDSCKNARIDVWVSMNDVIDHEEMCGCGEKMRRLFNIPQIMGDLPTLTKTEYYDIGLGEYVSSRTQQRESMKRKGLEEFSPTTEDKKLLDERKYLLRHARPKEVAKATNDAFAEASEKAEDKRRKAAIDQIVDKAVAEVPN